MFTGIVFGRGRVVSLERRKGAASVVVAPPASLGRLRRGESVCGSGVRLTPPGSGRRLHADRSRQALDLATAAPPVEGGSSGGSSEFRGGSLCALWRPRMAPGGVCAPAAEVILYEGADPNVRGGPFDLTGRRVAARAFPYGSTAGSAKWRFDPIERRFL